MKNAVFLGIDMGTTGIRMILTDAAGEIISVRSAGIEKSFVTCEDEHHSEQDPGSWELPLLRTLDSILADAASYELRAIAVDSTSGTVLPIDKRCRPISNALLHNDSRAREESEYIRARTGISVKPSFALSKIVWIKNKKPDLFENAYKFIHAADYIRGIISGDFETTDFSNAVKTGYDLAKGEWPQSIESVLGVPLQKLPEVVKTGAVIGELKHSIRERVGIKNTVKIVAGATDSTTGFYSSGARVSGDWNTMIGTVFGIRGIAEEFLQDPEGLIYAHRHPEGYWLPGAASNTGGEALRLFFHDDLKEYDAKIEKMAPTGAYVYPLARKSEKFPFLNMEARGFIKSDVCDPLVLFKAFLEGASYVERMIYEKIAGIGYAIGENIYSMGGGSYSRPWTQIRANVLKKNILKARVVETAFGAAIIAASGAYYSSMSEAIEHMVRMDLVFEPDTKEVAVYDELYEKFIDECRMRGYF
jgi:sugar (pentulose or hexulose) kinase